MLAAFLVLAGAACFGLHTWAETNCTRLDVETDRRDVGALVTDYGSNRGWYWRYKIPSLAGFIGGIVLWIWAIGAATIPAGAHDHNRPHLNGWYQGLRSPAGAPCCDGPHVDAMHLKDVDWTAQGKPGFQYRARIPKTGADMDKARRGEVRIEWVDVPDNAVLDQPNLDGTTLVWPTYGYSGKAIRCFMPGPMT